MIDDIVISSGNIDTTKKTVLVFAGGDIWGKKYSLDGWFQVQHKRYADAGIQVVYFGSKQSSGKHWVQFDTVKICARAKRQKESESASEFNRELLYKVIDFAFSKMNICEMWALGAKGQFILPMQPFVKKAENAFLNMKMNEFHDYVGKDASLLHDINNCVMSIKNRLFDGVVSATGFSSIHTRMNFQTWARLCTSKSPKTFSFIIDPSCFYPGFEWGQEHINYYFAKDNRGTRDFHASPFDWWQHEQYDATHSSHNSISAFFDSTESKHDKGLIFAGSIMYDKGQRSSKWHRFLRDFDNDGSALYIPLRANGVNQAKPENSSQTSAARRKHSQLWEEIANHKLRVPTVFPEKLIQIVQRYQYMLVLACVSLEDSLNFRPVFCAKHGLLPLLDPEFDPDYLMIPQDIQKKTTVNDCKDLKETIAYFDAHPKERQSLTLQLEEHLAQRKHINGF